VKVVQLPGPFVLCSGERGNHFGDLSYPTIQEVNSFELWCIAFDVTACACSRTSS
jgi:hypothetical protein